MGIFKSEFISLHTLYILPKSPSNNIKYNIRKILIITEYEILNAAYKV